MGAKEQELVPLHAGFDVVYRGFHRRQVIEHIENLEEQLRFTSLDRAEALAQAADLRKLLEMTRRDLEDARARIERLESTSGTHASATERMHRMLRLAEDETAEMHLQAERECADLRARTDVELAALRAEAERESAAMRAEAESELYAARQDCASRAATMERRELEMERRCADLEAQHRQRADEVERECAEAVAEAQADADMLLRETALQCNSLEADSERKREKAQQFFELTMTRRRNEAAQHLQEQEALARARSEFMVKMACREAQRRLAEVADRTAELHELKRVVHSQLSTARAALSVAADRVAPLHIPEQVAAS
ncbi:hypothetical protein SAMN04488074_111130 [Lentzea albidocapillata subsp. violacea]|uniref:DivIVA protein n=1 Tax=Lentzea albidocapillata subsp. violacea TaxID=128104 RepID=A0A1G9KF42_9PSEU|nr:hypothetical protein [Lentzea albidocapillata]SDL48500.1 hypothetical protein SAMN04488074_111130 [Lentzea albidocapillata subsp. violacea]